MGQIDDAFRTAWRDFNTDGVPGSGTHNPGKAGIRPIGAIIESEFAAEAAARAVETQARQAADDALGERISVVEALQVSGFQPISPVRVVAKININIANGLENGDTLDGVVLVTGDRVALSAQTDGTQNGVYVVPVSGAASRAEDADTGEKLARAAFFVTAGSETSTQWFVPTAEIVLGTTDIEVRKIRDADGEIVDARGGAPTLSVRLDTEAEENYFVNLGWYTGESVGVDAVPVLVTEDNYVISTTEQSAAAGVEPDYLAYVDDDNLRAVGGEAGDREVNADPGKTWIASQTYPGHIAAVYKDGDGESHLAAVSPLTGNIYAEGAIGCKSTDGQSNAEGQALASASVECPVNEHPNRTQMPATPANNAWLGMTTAGGASIDFNADDLYGFAALRDSIATGGNHGTLSIIAAAYRYARRAAMELGGHVPHTLNWSNAEGGQSIFNLRDDPPDGGKFAWSNLIKVMTRLQAVKPAGKRLRYDWMEMVQGESNSTLAALGEEHAGYRADAEALARTLWGQPEHERLRMASWQMSSFIGANRAGVLSILQRHLDERSAYGVFWCAGPTYPFPWYTDYLHHTSLGHAMRGEMFDAITMEVERTGYYDPLHMVSASVTGANEITVTLSEVAVIDEDDEHVAPVANAGIVVPDRTVIDVAVDGDTIVITTDEAAAGAASVEAALAGQSNPREEANINRSTIRSVASLGQYSVGAAAGMEMHKWLVHQSVAIS